MTWQNRYDIKVADAAGPSDPHPNFYRIDPIHHMGQEVDIDYQGAKDPAPRRRTIIPVKIQPHQVEAFSIEPDHPEGGTYKHFRFDRMGNIGEGRAPSISPLPPKVPQAQPMEPQQQSSGGSRRGTGVEHVDAMQQAIDNGHEVDMHYVDPWPGPSNMGPYKVTFIPISLSKVSDNNSEGHIHTVEGFVPAYRDYKFFELPNVLRITGTRPMSATSLPLQPLDLAVQRAIKQKNLLSESQPSMKPEDFYSGLLRSRTVNHGAKPDITPQEYDEIKHLDIDPNTHDKATVTRLRQMGASHLQLKDVCQQGIPLEDYESALKNHGGDHTKAVDEAIGYQNHYKKTIAAKREFLRENPSALEGHSSDVMEPEEYAKYARYLFQHHRTLRDSPSFTKPYFDVPGRRRANEWVMSECAKLSPELRKHIPTQLYKPAAILPTGNTDDPNVPEGQGKSGYSEIVNLFLNHHRRKLLNAGTVKEHVIHNRLINALTNIGHSQYYPSHYSPDVYEEE